MALSTKTKRILEVAMADRFAAAELAAAVDAGQNTAAPVAANVAELGPTADLVGVDGTGDNAAPVVETEARLSAIEAKLDELIGALVSAGLMDAPPSP